jgi:asparagine synthase (glutamine-hydrolysing)
MCGIAGILNFNQQPVTRDEIKRMTDVISHRGPDGEGHWINSSKTISLGHRRLSIIDLTHNGQQPMHYADGRYAITFNGEIYNYIELKNDLLKNGYSFKSDSDTEVLMALYHQHKENCLQLLDGMFSFAIWDEKEKTLFCARDRFGEKPFYFFKDKNRFVFASEIKQFWQIGIEKKVNEFLLYLHLGNKNTLTNFANSAETFFRNVFKLDKANYLIVKTDGSFTQKKYWDIDLKLKSDLNFNEACEKLREFLSGSVKRRLRSDVAVGSSLSGGLDSSTIVSIINEIYNGTSQKTFSARFKNFEKDEGEYINDIVSNTNAQAHYTWPDDGTLVTDITKLIYHQDEPFGTASIYAQWAVMKLAKEHKVTVLLDGQGADEMLAGYKYYYANFFHELICSNVNEYNKQKKSYSALYGDFPFSGNNSSSITENLKAKLKNFVRPYYRSLFNASKQVSKSTKSVEVFNPDFISQFNLSAQSQPQFQTLNEILYWSTAKHGLEDLLRFADRNSMAHSREVRLPFLNHHLVEFIFSLPATYKINDGWTKYILRQSFEGKLPSSIAWRKDKIGYEPPQGKWMENIIIREMIDDSVSVLKKK